MTIVIAGGTGFIGRTLVATLSRQGHDVCVISRRSGAGTMTWDDLEREGLKGAEAVINLAGAPVMTKAWTPAYKEVLADSRLEATHKIVEAVIKDPPRVFINASGVSYYPPDADAVYTEHSVVQPSEGFLSQMAHRWEAAAQLPKDCPTRAAIVRIGVVLGRGGGALERMLKPFKWGLGGRIGTGYQPFPWIHIDDLVSLFNFILTNDEARGPFNGTAPGTITNGQFTLALGKALKRPTFCTMPAPLIKLLLGERADLLLYGQRVIPDRSIQMGFSFAFESIESALADLI